MKTIFDYENKKSFIPYTFIKNDIPHYVFYKNIFNHHFIKNICKKGYEIYCTNSFKTQSPYISTYIDNYDTKKNQIFEDIIYDNMELILKSMNTNIKTVKIYSQKSDSRITDVIDYVSKYADVICLITSDTDFYKNSNSYSIKKYGIGLLRSLSKKCDIIVILNTNKNNFYKEANYVIDICKGHTAFNCNVLWDFYDKNNTVSGVKDIKKAYFIDKMPDFLNLRWKILKKS